jgi:hypothetical protein
LVIGGVTIDIHIYKKLQIYHLAVIFSVFFALTGFSYNVWRMEVSEENINIRSACFGILLKLSSLELYEEMNPCRN